MRAAPQRFERYLWDISGNVVCCCHCETCLLHTLCKGRASALKASTTDAVALVVCPLQVGVTGVKYEANMPISSILSYITELTWHISGNKKVSYWAVGAEAIRK